MSSLPPLFAEMFRAFSAAEFLRTYFLKQPYASAGTCFSARPLGDKERLVRLLENPQADVLIGRGGELRPGPCPDNLAAVGDVLREGYTIGLRHVDRIDTELADCARQWQEAFAAPVDIHLYCTPAGQPGFGWHYDAEDVFVLQTEGDKEWHLRKNTVNPWPLIETTPHNQRYEREIMPVMACHLAAGDWLYIPAGYWHQTRAGGESISLSIGLRSLTAVDLYDFLRSQLLQDLRWRQRLPPMGTLASGSERGPEIFGAMLQELAQDLQQRLTQESLIEQLVEFRRSTHSEAAPR